MGLRDEATTMYQAALPNLMRLSIEGVDPAQVAAYLSSPAGSALMIDLIVRRLEQDQAEAAAAAAAAAAPAPAPAPAPAALADATAPALWSEVKVTVIGGEVQVRAPKAEAFRQWAKRNRGRWDKAGKYWSFSRGSEPEVRAALRRLYGTDGPPVPTVGLRIVLTPLFLVDNLYRWTGTTKQGWTLSLHKELASSSGRFARLDSDVTLLSGTLPNEGAVLVLADVPQPLAARLVAEDPAHYALAPGSP